MLLLSLISREFVLLHILVASIGVSELDSCGKIHSNYTGFMFTVYLVSSSKRRCIPSHISLLRQLFDALNKPQNVIHSICTGSECSSYTLNNETDRSVLASPVGSIRRSDDALVTAWYCFNSTAGTRIPNTCVPIHMCNTDAPGWLNEDHPTPQEGIVDRRVCFHWNSNCCNWAITIKVRNCGLFYVYRLVAPPTFYLRYCVTK